MLLFLFSASREYKDKNVKAFRIIIVISQHIRCFDCWQIRDQIMQFLSSSVVSQKQFISLCQNPIDESQI